MDLHRNVLMSAKIVNSRQKKGQPLEKPKKLLGFFFCLLCELPFLIVNPLDILEQHFDFWPLTSQLKTDFSHFWRQTDRQQKAYEFVL